MMLYLLLKSFKNIILFLMMIGTKYINQFGEIINWNDFGIDVDRSIEFEIDPVTGLPIIDPVTNLPSFQ